MSRYERQVRCHAFGSSGQNRLENSTLLIIGAGALGSAVSEQLARAGAGRLVICDMDVVEYSNLHRQSCYTEEDAAANMLKADALAFHLKAINSNADIITVTQEVTSLNIIALIHQYKPDMVIDGTDAFSTRFLINEVCHKLQLPWVYGACLGTKGTVYAVDYTSACLKCLLADEQTSGQDCSIAGILPPVAHMTASMQTAEIMNYMANRCFSGQLLTFDMKSMRFQQTLADKLKNPDCKTCCHGHYPRLNERPLKVMKLCGGKYMVRLTPAHFTETTFRFQKSSPYFKYYEGPHYTISFFHDGRIIIQGLDRIEDVEHFIARSI
ncbi:HesA/MoeB/ThiF family protein [Macrococcus brunensis]|uniref:HesA/MoeB/ThiF family protein n=1 Tax=Macrococcus brunensis TaxID=198483 RepID=A0A4R6BF64_9STAP|nr:HesA/MoeB/ThiF family protein [Macrococcus brunensis]TDL98373.1 HesA/MoeB/ThiF family protein [Macrococcus brunensis]ULG72035.1 HesA/MoeB/ThiF family protein [Macrococcus brunensis]